MSDLIYQYILILCFSSFMIIGMAAIKRRIYVGANYRYRTNFKTFVIVFIMAALFILYTSFRQIEQISEIEYVSGGGLDSIVYKNIFLGLTGNFFDCIKNIEQEPVWLLWNYIIRLFTDRFEVFLISFFALEFWLVYKICKEFMINNSFVFCYAVIIVNLVLTSLCIMRATLSIFIIGYAMIELKRKHTFRSILIGVISVGIHYSSVIFFPSIIFYFIYKRLPHKTDFLYFIICLAMIPLGLLLGAGVQFVVQGTRYGATNYGYASGLLIFRLYMLFAIVYKFNKLDLRNRTVQIALAFFAANFLVFGMQVYMTMLYRLYLFASIAEFILLQYLCGIYKKTIKTNPIDCGVFMLLILLYLYSFVKFYFESVYTYGLLTYQSNLVGGWL